MSDSELRRLERLEERLNQAERDISSLAANQNAMKEELSRRILDTNENLKLEVERIRSDLRERTDDLKNIIKDNVEDLNDNINSLSDSVKNVEKQIQNLYITQSGANTKIGINEKIIWLVVAFLGGVALYLMQTVLTAGAV